MPIQYPLDPTKDCTSPKVTGRCRMFLDRWFYNTATNKCESFVYGGCDANGNNFKTEEECKKTCG